LIYEACHATLHAVMAKLVRVRTLLSPLLSRLSTYTTQRYETYILDGEASSGSDPRPAGDG